jgi:hypothetical protein
LATCMCPANRGGRASGRVCASARQASWSCPPPCSVRAHVHAGGRQGWIQVSSMVQLRGSVAGRPWVLPACLSGEEGEAAAAADVARGMLALMSVVLTASWVGLPMCARQASLFQWTEPCGAVRPGEPHLLSSLQQR